MSIVRKDPRVPAREECVVRYLLDRWAEDRPEAPFAVFWKGAVLTYREMRDAAIKTAAGLASLGVEQGDTVIVWLPNGQRCLETWFGINWLGAIYVPINLAYRGRILEHVIENAASTVIVAHADLVDRLEGIDLSTLKSVVIVGGAKRSVGSLEVLPESVLDGDPEAVPPLERPIEPWDTQSIIYTSGTTGPSKGVMSSYAHLWAMSGTDGFKMIKKDDRFLCNLPLFHVGGTIPVMGMLSRGGSVAIIGAFSTNNFWDQIRGTQATSILLLGAMATFIAKRPVSLTDRDHSLRTVIIVPLAEDAEAFSKRFGVTVWTLYNMSEISTQLVSGPNPPRVGICGKPRDGAKVRLVDEHDCEVEPGEVGELIVQAESPWSLNSGYFRDPAGTAKAWRNGWFHTGDSFFVNQDGDWVFFDRKKDAIRRRGENVSSFEVEAEIAAHPAVNEVAVVGVPSEVSEEDILCVVACVEGLNLDPVELIEFLRSRMAHFMVPRYVRIVPALPRTPTEKITKHTLRDEGVTEDTWDRESAGIFIKREKIG
ncbi:AMP-binding protein [Sulfitobacter pacificus]|uniref:ATP-dependent acyl-CoA ligase n=1 Tax=Sulfitobacter pacificus TaxID=1499314 RepID=A0ABQ5VQ22_9RHOB|nr:AMP-binding protein [Sulfitobacter pacificus]GLQ29191.1 ATP-dependent acyl-CoA ligase [Sulfitobacter pacificus]